MDCGSVYIKMCAKAEEIQSSWKPEKGDLYARWLRCYRILTQTEQCFALRWVRSPVGERAIGNWRKTSQPIWLPRQDQLQAMLACKYPSLIDEFLEWENDSYHLVRQRDRFNSMEQLWLAAVMDLKFKKRWDSQKEEWVKEG